MLYLSKGLTILLLAVLSWAVIFGVIWLVVLLGAHW